MGSCTSSTKQQEKDHHQLHKRLTLKNPIVADNKQRRPTIPTSLLQNQQSQRPHSILSNFDVQSASLKQPIFQPVNSNSLIHLYSANINNNNSNINSSMSSSSSRPNPPTRIPVSKNRFSSSQKQPSSIESVQSKTTIMVTTTIGTTNQTGNVLARIVISFFLLQSPLELGYDDS